MRALAFAVYGLYSVLLLVKGQTSTDPITVVAKMGPYPGSSPGSVVAGTVTVSATPSSLTLLANLTGLPPSTTAGIHIHSGTSCADAANVGGHWWNATVADPWNNINYTSDTAGVGLVQVSLTAQQLGYNPQGCTGHCVVVHTSTNARIACGVLDPQPTSAPMAPKATASTSDPLPVYSPLIIIGQVVGGICLLLLITAIVLVRMEESHNSKKFEFIKMEEFGLHEKTTMN